MTGYVLDLCDRIAAMTDVPGTTTRLFLTPATHRVHALLTAEMQALGMSVRVDSIGNLRGTYAGSHAEAGTLLMGSHIDTVPNAGRFDGVLGVAMALALVRMLAGERLAYALEVIAFSEEEGIRFRLPFLGSRALAGTLGEAELARTDADGVSIAQAALAFGLDAETREDCAPTPGTFAYFEPHIEQGPVLEQQGRALAVVTSIAGQTRLSVNFHGQANHAGTTPMSFRSDALMAAAQWMIAVEALAKEVPGLVATVGLIEAKPGAVNIIPGEVVLSLDVRHAQDKVRAHAVRRLLAKADSITRYRSMEIAGSTLVRKVSVSHTETSVQKSVAMHAPLTAVLQAAAEASGRPYSAMASGAGHDAMIVAGVLPAAMLFLRTPGGLSHHPAEAVLREDIQAGLEVCLRFLRDLDPRALRPQSGATD